MVIMANMQMERRKDGDYYYNNRLDRGLLMESTPHSKCYSQRCSVSSVGGRSSVGGSGNGALGYIEHTVSKFDTLAGVAIKYGVEVADIKRMNGLTTDRQMFALKTLQIPLPGRHPPSPIISNGPSSSEMTPVNDRHSDLFSSITSLKLSSQGYYGLKPNGENCVQDVSKPPVGTHRKCKSLLVNGLSENEAAGSDKYYYEKLVRRRKSEVDLKNHSPEPEMPPKHENSSTKKGLALQNLFPLGLMAETLNQVRKSSSTPSFQDSTSIWPTSMLTLTADLQPIFDALPNPIATRKKD